MWRKRAFYETPRGSGVWARARALPDAGGRGSYAGLPSGRLQERDFLLRTCRLVVYLLKS
jgi:hypothetical protein